MAELTAEKSSAIESAAEKAAKENPNSPNSAVDSFEAYKMELEAKTKAFEQMKAEAEKATETLKRTIAMAEVRGRSFAGQPPVELTEKEKTIADIQKTFPEEMLPMSMRRKK